GPAAEHDYLVQVAVRGLAVEHLHYQGLARTRRCGLRCLEIVGRTDKCHWPHAVVDDRALAHVAVEPVQAHSTEQAPAPTQLVVPDQAEPDIRAGARHISWPDRRGLARPHPVVVIVELGAAQREGHRWLQMPRPPV